MSIESINPMTGKVIRSFPPMTAAQVDNVIEKARRAFEIWRKESYSKRGEKMKKLAVLLRERASEYARLMAEEMGKPVSQGRKETEKCAWVSEFYAVNAEKFLSEEAVQTDFSKSYVTYEPLGLVLAVMPWNFPFWQVIRASAPTLMAGNVVLLKHASNVPGCAQALEKLFEDAEFPLGAFSNLFIETDHVDSLIEHPLVKAVTLTGSVPAGRSVAAKAGGVLKKTVLELGGNDPYVVFADADLAKTVQVCAEARLINGGQSCVAAKRFIVEDKIYEKFLAGLADFMKCQRSGDPLDEETTLGPMARLDLRKQIHWQVKESLKKGAKLIVGGQIPKGKGSYYPATVLGDVTKGMSVFDEEVFGPVAAVVRAKDEDEAIDLANDTVFGLGAAVFTENLEKGERIARDELKAGSAFVNANVQSDPRLPFGGIGQSGYGRELSSFGIREFVNVKTICVK